MFSNKRIPFHLFWKYHAKHEHQLGLTLSEIIDKAQWDKISKSCQHSMHIRTHKFATSLSLNKYIHHGSKNPMWHSSKSPAKPCDHFAVSLYQSLEKLKHTNTPYMLIPFMFWNWALKTFLIYIYINPPTLIPTVYNLLICCQPSSSYPKAFNVTAVPSDKEQSRDGEKWWCLLRKTQGLTPYLIKVTQK